MGPLSATWIHVETKLEILSLFEASQLSGVSVRRSCLILSIEHRRVVRWQRQLRQGLPLHNRTPGPNQPPHRLLPEEAAQIVSVATSEEYADLSHRILSVMAGDLGLFQASFSTVYRVLVAHDLMQARCPGGAHNGNSKGRRNFFSVKVAGGFPKGGRVCGFRFFGLSEGEVGFASFPGFGDFGEDARDESQE